MEIKSHLEKNNFQNKVRALWLCSITTVKSQQYTGTMNPRFLNTLCHYIGTQDKDSEIENK